jgi:hypothetical protein
MDRRKFMAALAGTPIAAKSVVTAVALPPAVPHAEEPWALAPKQQEAWDALHDPRVKAVLFSGGRACGKTHLANAWADGQDIKERGFLKPFAVLPSRMACNWWIEERKRRDKHFSWFRSAAVCDDLRGLGPFYHIIIENAHQMEPCDIDRAYAMMADGGKVLVTSLVVGDGMPWLRRMFPYVGWNGPSRYHVNASMMSNPYLKHSLTSARLL